MNAEKYYSAGLWKIKIPEDIEVGAGDELFAHSYHGERFKHEATDVEKTELLATYHRRTMTPPEHLTESVETPTASPAKPTQNTRQFDLMSPLTDMERSELVQYEQTIKQGLNTFFDVGIALAQIREKRLYRDHHDTFEEYCQERWEMSKTHANRFIASANVMKALKEPPAQMTIDEMTPGAVTPIGVSPADAPIEILPENESQVRPLTKLEPDLQRTAWAQVTEAVKTGAKLTAALVEEVVSRILTPKEPEPQPEPKPIPDERQIDIEEAISQAEETEAEPEEELASINTLEREIQSYFQERNIPRESLIQNLQNMRDGKEEAPQSETKPEPIKPEAAAILDALEQDRGWVNQIVKQFANSKYWPYDTTDHKLFREVTIRKPTGAKNRWGEDALKRYRLDAVAVIRINAHRYNPIIVGIEVKVDKHDLRHDAKMQEYLDYVDCFYLVTPRTLAVEKLEYRMKHPKKDQIGDIIVEAGQVELHQLAKPLTPDAHARQELATELLMKDLWKEADQVHYKQPRQSTGKAEAIEPLSDFEKNLEEYFTINGIQWTTLTDQNLREIIKLAKRELTRRHRTHMEGDQDLLTHHKLHAPKFEGMNKQIEAGERLIAAEEKEAEEAEPAATTIRKAVDVPEAECDACPMAEAEHPLTNGTSGDLLCIKNQDPLRFRIIQLKKLGFSVRKIAAKLDEEGFTTSKSAVDRIIRKAQEEGLL